MGYLQLHKGDSVTTYHGNKVVIDAIDIVAKRTTVHNFEVDGYHTYYVSHQQVLVHNNGPCDNLPCPNTKGTKEFQTRRQAFRQAKRDAGVPTSETHTTHVNHNAADRFKSKGTDFKFKNNKEIQEHMDGHPWNRTSHFNNHSSTQLHYNYKTP